MKVTKRGTQRAVPEAVVVSDPRFAGKPIRSLRDKQLVSASFRAAFRDSSSMETRAILMEILERRLVTSGKTKGFTMIEVKPLVAIIQEILREPSASDDPLRLEAEYIKTKTLAGLTARQRLEFGLW